MAFNKSSQSIYIAQLKLLRLADIQNSTSFTPFNVEQNSAACRAI